MPQPSLFASTPQQLVADVEGGIRYFPDVVDAARAGEWFDDLLATLAWKSERRPMYDRVVDVPRLMASHALDDPSLPAVLAALRAAVSGVIDAPFTHVGLNLYRDGRDSVAPHNDKLHTLVSGQPIALLSLGDTRRMDIRDKLPPRLTRRIDLEPGSVLVMSHASQSHYDHGIPKTREAVGPRISAVFRVRRGPT